MDIRADVWDRVMEFAVQLANEEQREKYWSAYNALRDYCETQSLAWYDHPFLWETLADFTIDDSIAVPIYQRALDGSSGEEMRDFRVSIRFALAERHKAKGEDELAREYAIAADDEAKHMDDLELRRRISKFLLSRE
ncbi:hypothetical protein SAMN05216570_0138 [Dyella sp. OK004]|uniref:hypothetical protein n=1 Tax=Dyella sp. OK004 TaxID=1855292 RepID=UPI0008E399A5|nr:hypothetical protein [Dyella sp. OK004]SFR86804.1 hypothetical protein SAMN05216570_0138 [Dyella sp. OK004]